MAIRAAPTSTSISVTLLADHISSGRRCEVAAAISTSSSAMSAARTLAALKKARWSARIKEMLMRGTCSTSRLPLMITHLLPGRKM